MGGVIVDCAVYRDGKREDVPGGLREALARTRADGNDDFLWVGLHEPGEREFSELADEFALHPLAVEDAVHAHQRPKLEQYGDSLFLVLKTLHYKEERSAIEVGEIMVFLGPGFIVTVRHGPGNPLADVRRRLEDDRELLRCGPSAALHAICDQIVDTYGSIANEIDQDVEELEQSVFSPERTNDAARIYALKREVLAFRRAIVPLVEPMRVLMEGRLPGVHEDTRAFFRDVADHVARVSEQVEAFDDLLTSVLNANLTQVSLKQNEDMRRISAWVAILAIPTVVAGVYGMNFQYMPALDWRYGYFAVLAGTGVLCYLIYRLFRRSGWL